MASQTVPGHPPPLGPREGVSIMHWVTASLFCDVFRTSDSQMCSEDVFRCWEGFQQLWAIQYIVVEEGVETTVYSLQGQ